MLELTIGGTGTSGVTCALGDIDDPADPWPDLTYCAAVWIDEMLTHNVWEYVDAHPDTSAPPTLEAFCDGTTLKFRHDTNPTDVTEFTMHRAYLSIPPTTVDLYVLEKI